MANSTSFVNLLASQGVVDLDSPEPPFSSQFSDESRVKERRKWSPKKDIILIGAWLNTRKDPIVGNEQKAGHFWKRNVEYYNSSPLLVGKIPRELGQCKQRWARINDLGINFNLEHAWRELRNDVKWSSTYLEKDSGKDKRKPVDSDAQGSVTEPQERPMGVKAAKAAGKRKKLGKEEELGQLKEMMETKKQISNQSLLASLVAKTEPLSDMEEALKMKLLSEMLSLLMTPFRHEQGSFHAYCRSPPRKDVERAFGVLQARFAIVKNPAILWEKRQIGMAMRTCIILHNMIVENERNGYTQYDTSEFEEGTSTRSSNVDAPDTSEMPPNFGNMLLIRTHVRDRHLHERLKNDLIENIWNKFGNDEDE
uniref:Uncharacterized protein n=1 Tax=Brassica oleracea var. oleracea TaxID=109376 RepID=A0A0D3CCW3_BRAOL